MTKVEKAHLEWAGGLIDGDGSIGLYGPWNALYISVGKAKTGYTSLHKMKELFGGRINKTLNEKDNRQECSSWVIGCQDALAFCQLIEPYVVIKKNQFTRALEYPLNKQGYALTEDMKHLRLAIKNDLKRMKKEADDPIAHILPDAYYAGFFDSEGCIEALGFNQIHLSVPQKYRAICDSYEQRFGGSISCSGGKYHWRQSRADKCLEVLRAIQPYSIEKLPQVELVLNMKTNEAPIVNRLLKKYKGNQLGKPSPTEELKQPQKRLHDLPRYISYVRRKNENCGYTASYKEGHGKFSSSKETMEVKFAKALECLEKLKQQHGA